MGENALQAYSEILPTLFVSLTPEAVTQKLNSC